MEIPIEQPETKTEKTGNGKPVVAPKGGLLCGIEQMMEDVRARKEQLEKLLEADRPKEETPAAFLFKQGEILATNVFWNNGKPASLPFGLKRMPINTPREYVEAMKFLFEDLYRDFKRREAEIYSPNRDNKVVTDDTGDRSYCRRRYPEEIRELRLEQEKETTEMRKGLAFIVRDYQFHIEGFVNQAVIIVNNHGYGSTDNREKLIVIIIDLLALLRRDFFCRSENIEKTIDVFNGFVAASVWKILDKIHERVKKTL